MKSFFKIVKIYLLKVLWDLLLMLFFVNFGVSLNMEGLEPFEVDLLICV